MNQSDLGVASQRLVLILRHMAKRDPVTHRLGCCEDGCSNDAVESWFFCSRECRDGYVFRWINEHVEWHD